MYIMASVFIFFDRITLCAYLCVSASLFLVPWFCLFFFLFVLYCSNLFVFTLFYHYSLDAC